MYKIGELSKLCGLPVKTLRYYDSIGLLVPDEIDRFTGYRYYSASKLADCNRIVALKTLGFSLDEISKHINAESVGDIVALINTKTGELKSAIAEAETQLRRLYAVKEIITEGEKQMYDMVIKSSDPLRVAMLRKLFKTKEDAYRAMDHLKNALPRSVVGQRSVIINYETEYKECDFDLAVCVEITSGLPKDSEYEERILSFSDDTASVICPKDELDSAYRSLQKQLHDMPAQITGAFYEICYDSDTVELKVPIQRLSAKPKKLDAKLESEFKNDAAAIGAWSFIDLVPSREQYSPYNRKYSNRDSFWHKEIYFLQNGEGYWVFPGWTKGSLYNQNGNSKAIYRYSIENIGGETIMFLEMHYNSYYTLHGGKPHICVYKKSDSIVRTSNDIRVRDNVDLTFMLDKRVVGKWTVCDFCRKTEEFDPKTKCWEDGLFFNAVEFSEDGKAKTTFDTKKPFTVDWTKGFLLDKKKETASAYEIKELDGREYLFIEWKSGDYIFGKRKPCYYVFSR